MVPPKASTKPKSAPNSKRKIKRSEGYSAKEPSNNQDGTIETSASSTVIPLELNQLLLNIFKTSFAERLSLNFTPLLQEVKQHLYNRDFLKAFGRNDYLEAYAARWSPSRALGYLEILNHLSDHISPTQEQESERGNLHRKIVCLGGGAGAEIVALAGFLSLFQRRVDEGGEGSQSGVGSEISEHLQRQFEVIAIDIGSWTPVVEALQASITTAPPLSKYASTAAKAVNVPLAAPHSFHITFRQHDILSVDFSELSPFLADANLITLMFTLNELYSTSLSQTQMFLLSLTSCLQPGALLLVVDSPGSYSTVPLNGTEKKYPMQWLLDHTLLHTTTTEDASDLSKNEGLWDKPVTYESRWFRLPERLKYPIELENMRYQLHLFKRR